MTAITILNHRCDIAYQTIHHEVAFGKSPLRIQVDQRRRFL